MSVIPRPGEHGLLRRVAFLAIIAVLLFYLVFPLYWALNTSLQPSANLFKVRYAPIPPSFEYYKQVFRNPGFMNGLLNSVLAAGGTVLLSLALGAPCAYALARTPFRGKRIVAYSILAMTMFPSISVLGALFQLVSTFHLYNKVLGLMLVYLLTTLPFTIWVLTDFFRSMPRELEESAWVDGANPLQVFLLILLPLAGPGLVSTGLLAFIAAWNEYLFALAFTLDDSARTVPVVIANFAGESQHETPWGSIMAASVLVTFPLLALVAIFQRRIVEGLTAGAVKG